MTGATGFIVDHLVKQLRQISDIQLILISRKPRVEQSRNVTCMCSSLDELSQETWQMIGVSKIAIIFHFAAFPPKSMVGANNVAEIYRGNLFGTQVLFESLPSRPKRFVFASTIDIFAMYATVGMIYENYPSGVSGLYGVSKLFCEQLVSFYIKLYDCSHAISRYGLIFSPGEDSYEKLMPSMIRCLSQGEPPVLSYWRFWT